jgi:hypothetical protein
MLQEHNAIANVTLESKNYGVYFIPQDAPVFSANEIFSIMAIFDSPEIDGGHGFVSWNKLNIDCDKFDNTEIYVFLRSYDQKGNVGKSSWSVPFLKYQDYDVSEMSGAYFQIRVLMNVNNLAIQHPKLNKISLSCFKIGEEEGFFTKSLDLGFKPKHIFLTYNAPDIDGTMIRFAITDSRDSIDPFRYRVIQPDAIDDIEDVPITTHMKLMLSGIGKRTVPFVVDEFAFILSGESGEQQRIVQ